MSDVNEAYVNSRMGSKCHCGLTEIPLGTAMFNYGGEVHAVTACTRSADWKARAEKAEAALQRVREVVMRVVETRDILRVLDVPCPTCSGPIRETVGLVCQTCGTDYGASDE